MEMWGHGSYHYSNMSSTESQANTDWINLLSTNIKFIVSASNHSSANDTLSGNTTEGLLDALQEDPLDVIIVNWLFILFSAVVLVIGLLGNCLVWFAVWRNPRMRSATNIFLVNLAVADFLVILICLPPTVAEDITGVWYLGQEMCKIVKCLQKISVLVSVLTLTAIALERWLAICQPLMFRHTMVRAKRAVAIVWAISLVSAVPDAISQDTHLKDGHVVCEPSWSQLSSTIQLWIMFVLFYLVPLVIMTVTYVKVALCLWRSGFTSDNDEASANVPRAQILLRRKKAKMLIVVVALFAVCYLPVYVQFLLSYAELMDYFPWQVVRPLFMFSHWLCYFNSAINPAIYNFMSSHFRREFRIACHICCRSQATHSTIYEALRLRNHNKNRLRQEMHQTTCPTMKDNSCSLQTQSMVLGTLASSCSSLCPQNQSNPNLLAPNYVVGYRATSASNHGIDVLCSDANDVKYLSPNQNYRMASQCQALEELKST
ncbi:orexin/Hypocretin receptor type 1-like isoform X2 [Biomphalaria glabrata]|uniref:Orexin/Hypocretin receptor type 1-like isoform X2 n=1 Tax=Biomphalaria glabrata TaxID=6526 RepID=A0A9W3ABF9_BIOGL|nr:orexin/Hypocretin receptor type 1-like isoform X2 [Biomphalaria glabrata]